jgi:salicylate hydroxylase
LGQRKHYGDEMLRKYKANFWDIHRADLQLALYAHAQELGVKFRFNVLVEKHDFSIPQVTMSNGEKIDGDLIVAADGMEQ